MNYVYQGSPNESSEVQRSGLHQLLGELQAGDCLAVTSLSGVADSSASLLELLDDLKQRGIRFRSVEEGLDTGTPEGQTAVALLRAALALDGETHAAPEEAAPKGRKPIEIDEELFDEILERWKNGEITARQAMAELNLKPNTFYRRVKERESKSPDSPLLDAAKKFGKEIVNTVTEGSEELQQAAGKFAADYDLASITDTVKKNITAAGKVFSSRMDSLSKDFQDAMQRSDRKPEPPQAESQPESHQEAQQEPPQTEAPETAEPDDAQNPEYL